MGSDHAHDHRAREPYSGDRPPGPEARTSSERGEPTPASRSRNNAVRRSPCRDSSSWLRPAFPAWHRHGESSSAIHADTGETAWRTTLGDLRSAFELASVPPTGALNLGGPVTTTTGLVFIGATIDPHLRAFETKSGRQVWEAAVTYRRASHTAPVHDGERARDDRDRGRWLRFAALETRLDARGLRSEAVSRV